MIHEDFAYLIDLAILINITDYIICLGGIQLFSNNRLKKLTDGKLVNLLKAIGFSKPTSQ